MRSKYVKKVNTQNFLNTAVYPNEKDPQPIVFVIDNAGIKEDKELTEEEKKIGAALLTKTSAVSGNWCSE